MIIKAFTKEAVKWIPLPDLECVIIRKLSGENVFEEYIGEL